MFCPLCQAEYREGFTECADCGVALVESLPTAEEHAADDQASLPAVTLWHGHDPVLFSRITHELMEAEIPFHSMMEMDHKHMPMFPVGMQYGKRGFKVFVHRSDLEQAQSLLPTPVEEVAAEYSTQVDEGEPPIQSMPQDFDENEATAVIWQGSDGLLAQAIFDCLAANGIGSARLSATGGSEVLLVVPRDISQAEPLVRQVVEGEVPPELAG